MDQNYLCEVDSELENEWSIGDEITTWIGVDRIRESNVYDVVDKNKKKYILANVQNLVCIYYSLDNYDNKC